MPKDSPKVSTIDRAQRVCLVGAGSIAATHAQVLQEMQHLNVVAVVDPVKERAYTLASQRGIANTYQSIKETLDDAEIDRVHICVPPDLHVDVAEAFLERGIAAFVEKPFATSAKQARYLADLAESSGTFVGVNHNFVHYPAFNRLQQQLEHGAVGQLVSVDCLFNVPLRQISAGQFSHWMFAEPKNLLLEQAVHPLSQICHLLGPVAEVSGLSGAGEAVAPGKLIYTRCDVSLACALGPAHLRFAVGTSYPLWLCIAIGEDGALVCDMIGNRLTVLNRGRWLEPVDQLLGGIRTGGRWISDAGRNALDYVLSLASVKGRSDAFYLSMRGSIAAFHDAVTHGTVPQDDGVAGASVVDACEKITAALGHIAPVPTKRRSRSPRARAQDDIVIIGGTGFIGRQVVPALLETQRPVTVFARSVDHLSEMFADDRIELIAGNISSEDDVRRLTRGAAVVINLAHGGGGPDWRTIERTMVRGAELVANACLANNVKRLIHVSSIAALYLGDPRALVTNATSPDPQPELRADYARGKAVSEGMLVEMHARRGLPVCVLRPGVVVGPGTSPFHSGIGFFNNEQHCIGWNAGTNPLPLILVSDVASAISSAIDAPCIEGTSLNLVGDVRLTAREYIATLAEHLQRPLRYYPQNPYQLFLSERAKWLIKRAAGVAGASSPTLRDLKSRGLVADIDCSGSKAALGWQPVCDRREFIAKAFTSRNQS